MQPFYCIKQITFEYNEHILYTFEQSR